MSFTTTDICLILIAAALWVLVLWGLDITA